LFNLNAGGTAGIFVCPVPEYFDIPGLFYVFISGMNLNIDRKWRENMEFMEGVKRKETLEIGDILASNYEGKLVKINGAVHTIRDMGDVAFVILRKREGLVQCVFEQGTTNFELKDLKEAATIEVEGIVSKEERAPQGFEVRLKEIKLLSEPTEAMPIPISKWKLNTSLETKLSLRPIALRNLRERAKFKIQEGVVRGFRDFLTEEGFTEIHTPKISSKGAEGGANIFKLEYFHRPAVLAQSPQFYKQMMVGVFDRVFETAPVFRAEKHNTKRHLNEYTSLDFEMGYIDSFEDIMAMETGFLQYTTALLQKEYAKELKMLNVELPNTDKIPAVRFDKAKELVAEKYNRQIKNPYDLEPEEEVLIGQYFKEEYDADFVFITHYPSKKRPFYAMEDPQDETFTLSFDLLFKGMEITTGGQRIHDYNMLMDKIEKRGMTEEGMEHYLMVFKHGMPPHGGLGIGMERLVMKILDEDNVRETTLFPRDMNRLEP
jgi:nondiscriminating aspartyl-tRNA synthetase